LLPKNPLRIAILCPSCQYGNKKVVEAGFLDKRRTLKGSFFAQTSPFRFNASKQTMEEITDQLGHSAAGRGMGGIGPQLQVG
jgi:hypothetical protein